MTIAAITMVYNEPVFLPLWLGYYGRELGYENLFVIDHGSDDGSTINLCGANRICLPRSPQDNDKRTRFVSDLVTNFLEYFDSVIYTDSDEFIIPDPRAFSNLREYVEARVSPVVTAVGLNVVQKRSVEAGIGGAKDFVLSQRRFVRLSSPMCKPILTSQPINWTPGFHGGKSAPKFEDLYLFHLRYFDFELGLKRLYRSRNQAWAKPESGQHQRVSDATWNEWFESFDRMPCVGSIFSDSGGSEVEAFKKRFISGSKLNGTSHYVFQHEISSCVLEIPSEFSTKF